MATGGIERHPSYNNKYKAPDHDYSKDQRRTSRRLSSISENLQEQLDAGKLDMGRLSFSESARPKRHLSRMTSSESCHSDDVFMECGQRDMVYNDRKVPLGPTVSSASTASILPNPYNRLNHKFHSIFWCMCCFYFVFFCCMPAVRFMEMSDKEYRRGNDILAHKHGRTSSACYILGTILSFVIYGSILALVIYFTKYLTS